MTDDHRTGTVTFRHDVDHAPRLRLALGRYPEVEPDEPPTTVGLPAVVSSAITYGQRTSVRLPAGTYLFAAVDDDGGPVGDPLPLELAVAGTETVTAETIIFALFLEPAAEAGPAPAPGAPNRAVHGTGILQFRHDVEHAPAARCRIDVVDPGGPAPGTAAGPRTPAAVGPGGRTSPALRHGQRWNTLLPPGVYAVSTRTADDHPATDAVTVTVAAHDITWVGRSESS